MFTWQICSEFLGRVTKKVGRMDVSISFLGYELRGQITKIP